MTKRRYSDLIAGVLLVTGLALALAHAAHADFEVTAPDGRRILLKDDGTWRYSDGKDTDLSKEKPKEAGEAVLQLQRKTEVSSDSCRFELGLANHLPYEIRQFVPVFSAHRANGVVYDSVSSGFFSIKPGNSQTQEILFRGIACRDIARVKVVGGDRCQMGDLDRFSADQGKCLARVRVMESNLVRFDK